MTARPRYTLPAKSVLPMAIAALLLGPGVRAATITVDSVQDDGTGCTLREAIASINAGSNLGGCVAGGSFGSGDTILFASLVSGAIELQNGQLSISKSLTIEGPITNPLAVDAKAKSRVFNITGSGVTVSIQNLSIRNGATSGRFEAGGGIYLIGGASLFLSNSTVSGNSSAYGGGIHATDASMTLSSSVVSGNSALLYGGGVDAFVKASVTLIDSTISNNSSGGYGGAINAYDLASVTLLNSTVSGNSAASEGGGISAVLSSSVSLINSTVSYNSASQRGGGIDAGLSSHITLTNSTVSSNSSTNGGGGIDARSASSITMTNTLLAGNNHGDCFNSSSTVIASHSLIGDTGSAACGLTENGTTGNIVGVADPRIGPLTDNGCLTPAGNPDGPAELYRCVQTHALLADSPALDSATSAGAPATDQRGVPRPQGAGYDIGAFEADTFCGTGLEYTTGQWSMLALPCVPHPDESGTIRVTDILGDDTTTNLPTNLYGTSGTGWALFKRILTTTPAQYEMLSANNPFDTRPGHGYWFKSYAAPTGNRLQVEGAPTPTTVTQAEGCLSAYGCVAVPVQTVRNGNRFNLVGNPFPYAIDWADVRIRVKNSDTLVGVYSPSQAAGLGDASLDSPVLSNQIWIWNGNSYDTYNDATQGMEGQLRYFTAFWVNVLPGAFGYSVELLIPAQPGAPLSALEDEDTHASPARLAAQSRSWSQSWLDWLIPTAAADASTPRGLLKIPPGHTPEQRPARGWARHTPHEPAPSAQDPHFDLMVSEGIWSQGLDPQAAQRAAHTRAYLEGREWFVRLKVDEPATGFKDHNNVFGQLLTALDGADRHDLIELQPYAAPWLTLVFPRPGWGARAGDYASDFRAAQRHAARGRALPGLPAGDWPFELRSDRPGTEVVLSWEGPAEVLARSRLIDHASGAILAPATLSAGYPVSLDTATRAFTWRFMGGVLPAHER